MRFTTLRSSVLLLSRCDNGSCTRRAPTGARGKRRGSVTMTSVALRTLGHSVISKCSRHHRKKLARGSFYKKIIYYLNLSNTIFFFFFLRNYLLIFKLISKLLKKKIVGPIVYCLDRGETLSIKYNTHTRHFLLTSESY